MPVAAEAEDAYIDILPEDLAMARTFPRFRAHATKGKPSAPPLFLPLRCAAVTIHCPAPSFSPQGGHRCLPDAGADEAAEQYISLLDARLQLEDLEVTQQLARAGPAFASEPWAAAALAGRGPSPSDAEEAAQEDAISGPTALSLALQGAKAASKPTAAAGGSLGDRPKRRTSRALLDLGPWEGATAPSQLRTTASVLGATPAPPLHRALPSEEESSPDGLRPPRGSQDTSTDPPEDGTPESLPAATILKKGGKAAAPARRRFWTLTSSKPKAEMSPVLPVEATDAAVPLPEATWAFSPDRAADPTESAGEVSANCLLVLGVSVRKRGRGSGGGGLAVAG